MAYGQLSAGLEQQNRYVHRPFDEFQYLRRPDSDCHSHLERHPASSHEHSHRGAGNLDLHVYHHPHGPAGDSHLQCDASLLHGYPHRGGRDGDLYADRDSDIHADFNPCEWQLHDDHHADACSRDGDLHPDASLLHGYPHRGGRDTDLHADRDSDIHADSDTRVGHIHFYHHRYADSRNSDFYSYPVELNRAPHGARELS